jgi:sarcosine oxidase subunit alpha
MGEPVKLRLNGEPIQVPSGTIVAAAIARKGLIWFRHSVTRALRGPLCGMGVCMDCRVTINGKPNCRSCQTVCEEGMEVRTDE